MKKFLNPKEGLKNFYTGIVVTLYPFTFKLVASDSAVPAILTSSLVGLAVGKKVLLTRIENQFVVLSVIGNDYLEKCFIEKHSSQSIPTATETIITFSSSDIVFDPMNMFDDSNDRIVIPEAGLYKLTCGGRFADDVSNGRLIYILINGNGYSNFIAGQDGGGRFGGTVTMNYSLSVDDYIQMRVYQTSGGNLNFGDNDSRRYTYLQVEKI